MNLDSIVGHGRRSAHVRGQLLKRHLDLLRCSSGIGLRVRAYDGQSISELEHLLVAQNRPIPAISFVRGERDETGDAIPPFHVLVSDHFVNAGHLFGFRGVDGQDLRVGDLGLNQRQAARFPEASCIRGLLRNQWFLWLWPLHWAWDRWFPRFFRPQAACKPVPPRSFPLG